VSHTKTIAALLLLPSGFCLDAYARRFATTCFSIAEDLASIRWERGSHSSIRLALVPCHPLNARALVPLDLTSPTSSRPPYSESPRGPHSGEYVAACAQNRCGCIGTRPREPKPSSSEIGVTIERKNSIFRYQHESDEKEFDVSLDPEISGSDTSKYLRNQKECTTEMT
jgi:hypothetical protein